jgi:curved DNA-binding protein CbpA
MNCREACKILGITMKERSCEKIVKRKYYELSLMYHPDKNKEEGAENKFKEVNEAYHYLIRNTKDDADDAKISMFEVVLGFFNNSLDEQVRTEVFTDLSQKLLFLCEKQIMKMMEHASENNFMKIYKLTYKYRHILHLSESFYQFMEKKKVYWFAQGSLKKRESYDDNKESDIEDALDDSDWGGIVNDSGKLRHSRSSENIWEDSDKSITENEFKTMDTTKTTMVLRPVLDDVLLDNVYKYVYMETNSHESLGPPFIIPLWHHELVYENPETDSDFVVKIIPKLPSPNYWIDDENNLHQIVEYTVYELWDYVIDNKCVEVYFGKKRFVFYPTGLTLKPEQEYTWKNAGISIINSTNVYDTSKRADVVLHVHISGVL